MARTRGIFAKVPTGVFQIKSFGQARNFFFDGLAKMLRIPRTDFKRKGFGLFPNAQAKLIFSIEFKEGGNIEVFREGLEELIRIFKSPRILDPILIRAYKQTFSLALKAAWSGSLSIAGEFGGGRQGKFFGKSYSTRRPPGSLSGPAKIIQAKFDDVKVIRGNVSIPPIISFINDPALQVSSKSFFRSVFMILEFGTGVHAFNVRSFQSVTATPSKVPQRLGADPGQWISNRALQQKMREHLKGRIVKGKRVAAGLDITSRARPVPSGKEFASRVPWFKVPFGLIASRGRQGLHSIFDSRTGKVRAFKEEKKLFEELVAADIDNLVRQKVPKWKNLVSESVGKKGGLAVGTRSLSILRGARSRAR